MTQRTRWMLSGRISAICTVLALGVSPASVLGQAAPEPDPSPLAPGDLKHPIFDTSKPVYDTAHEQEKSAGTVVAEVEGRSITLGDVSDAIAELPPSVKSLPFDDLYPSVLAQLVRQQALVIRAQHQALDEDPAVRRKVKAASDRVMADQVLEHEIRPTITEQALLERYNKDIANKPGPDEVHLRVIMVPTEEAAQGIITELQAGADFATLAKRSSTDSTASVGGDLGFLRMDGLNAEVGSVAFAIQPGQFTPHPFHTSGGWFVVKVEERRPGPTLTFAEAREGLVQTMLHEGVGDVVTRAMKDVTVREYSIGGKELTGDTTK
jgi:peptidyl-prolyl cis-trans isomerase C